MTAIEHGEIGAKFLVEAISVLREELILTRKDALNNHILLHVENEIKIIMKRIAEDVL